MLPVRLWDRILPPHAAPTRAAALQALGKWVGTPNKEQLRRLFACAGDGSPPNSWIHWFRNNSPAATNATVDLWPDTSELEPDELFATSMTYSNGTPAKLYSGMDRAFRCSKRQSPKTRRSRPLTRRSPRLTSPPPA